jgi:hypothetical protein
MKKLLMTSLILLSSLSMAETDSAFELCNSGDRNLLKAATVRGNQSVNDLIKKDVIENEVSCMVSKPRKFHPAVCGAYITQIDTFIINTKTAGTYSIVVDSSYSSCARMRVIPMVKQLTFTPTIKPVYFP